MKIIAKQPLFQFGVMAYKGQTVEVDDKTGKKLVGEGFAEAVKDAKEKPKKAKK